MLEERKLHVPPSCWSKYPMRWIEELTCGAAIG
jgi:hypothetical protein